MDAKAGAALRGVDDSECLRSAALQQVIATMYVALADAAGGPDAFRRANQVIRHAIEDRAVSDPLAIRMLEGMVAV